MAVTTSASTKERIISLDAFRGLTIMLMILVNNPGSWSSIYWPFKHAPWHGCTPTDLVFPFFLFIVGVAISLSLESRKQAGSIGPVCAHVAYRSAVLFSLGLLLSGFGLLFKLGPEFSVGDLIKNIRIPGVLQRIALCYFAASVIFLVASRRAIMTTIVVLLLGYWAAMELIPVPIYGAGMIDGKDTHLAAYIDREVLGENHLWSAAKTWDPEGILSTLPALATTLLGVLTGLWLKREQSLQTRLVGLLAAGIVLAAIGYLWGFAFPINKPLWTSSYAVFTSGMAMLVFCACIFCFDWLQWKRPAKPLVVYGVNALTVFVLSGLLGRLLVEIQVGTEEPMALKTWIYESLFHSWLSAENASLAYAVAWVVGWYIVLAIMYSKNWILKI